jgi:hypothetical protein
MGLPGRTTLRTLGIVVEGTPQHFIEERQFTGGTRVRDHYTSPSCLWAKRAQARTFFTRAPARSRRATPPLSGGLRAAGTAAAPLSAGAPGNGTRWYRVDNKVGAQSVEKTV